MKRKLWIYGCSYSDFWGDEGTRDDNSWVRILERELDLECTHHTIDEDQREWEPYCIQNTTPFNKVEYTWRNKAGHGFSYHRELVLEDCLKWKPQDIVIIGESVRVRAYTPYLAQEGSETYYGHLQDEETFSLSQEKIKSPKQNRAMMVFNSKHINSNGVDNYNNNLDITDIHLYRELVSWKLWYTTINVILTNRPTNTFVWNFAGKSTSGSYWTGGQHTPTIQPINGQMLKGYFQKGGWKLPHWDDYKERWKENFLHFPWGRDNYQEFIASHPTLFYDWEGLDDHQSLLAHKLQAESFVEQIRARMK